MAVCAPVEAKAMMMMMMNAVLEKLFQHSQSMHERPVHSYGVCCT